LQISSLVIACNLLSGPPQRVVVQASCSCVFRPGDDSAVLELDNAPAINRHDRFFQPMVDVRTISADTGPSPLGCLCEGRTPLYGAGQFSASRSTDPPRVVRRILEARIGVQYGLHSCLPAVTPATPGSHLRAAVIGNGSEGIHPALTAAPKAGACLSSSRRRLGSEFYSAAFKRDALSPEAYQDSLPDDLAQPCRRENLQGPGWSTLLMTLLALACAGRRSKWRADWTKRS